MDRDPDGNSPRAPQLSRLIASLEAAPTIEALRSGLVPILHELERRTAETVGADDAVEAWNDQCNSSMRADLPREVLEGLGTGRAAGLDDRGVPVSLQALLGTDGGDDSDQDEGSVVILARRAEAQEKRRKSLERLSQP